MRTSILVHSIIWSEMSFVVSTQSLMGNNQHHQAEIFLHIQSWTWNAHWSQGKGFCDTVYIWRKENIPLALSDLQSLHLTLSFHVAYSIYPSSFLLSHFSLLYRRNIVFAVIPYILLSISLTILLYPVLSLLGWALLCTVLCRWLNKHFLLIITINMIATTTKACAGVKPQGTGCN